MLKRLFPALDLNETIIEFKKILEDKVHFIGEEVNSSKEECLDPSPSSILKWEQKGKFFLVGIPVLTALMIILIVAYHFLPGRSSQDNSPIRSDLVLPNERVLLHRPDLLSQIDNKFRGSDGIQTIALVGIGGAGKTTLSRQYARQQQVNFLWEINSETKESLINSLENLAYALAKTEDSQKKLKGIQEIKKSREREEKIIQFIKECLKLRSPWFLVYDNVVQFSDIQQYFPNDEMTWGKGKVILTTRNVHIQSNNYVNDVVPIGELTPQEKFDFFTKITKQNYTNFYLHQNEETKRFLEHIPSFPLDVSLAANYLKATNTPFTAYLKHMNQNNKEFLAIQENLLKEASNYTKTRASIVMLSLQQLISAHKDFGEFLLFISLCDSQHIPKKLLEEYKDKAIVDNLIYKLKKYSLIATEESISSLGPSLSIHRNTQAIILAYFIKTLSLDQMDRLLATISETLENFVVKNIEREDIASLKLLLTHCEKFRDSIYHKHLIQKNT